MVSQDYIWHVGSTDHQGFDWSKDLEWGRNAYMVCVHAWDWSKYYNLLTTIKPHVGSSGRMEGVFKLPSFRIPSFSFLFISLTFSSLFLCSPLSSLSDPTQLRPPLKPSPHHADHHLHTKPMNPNMNHMNPNNLNSKT